VQEAHRQEVEGEEEADDADEADEGCDPSEGRLGLRIRWLGWFDALGAELGFLALALFTFELGVDLCIGTGDSGHQLPPKERVFCYRNLGFYRGFLSIIVGFLAKIDLRLKTL
jgi:hypothetical protein